MFRTRTNSKRSGSKKIRPDMISRPQNDLRHTGHIGYDGAIFGDVSFIGDNYDKLPIKTASIGKLDESRNSINLSRMSDSPGRDHLSLSDSSLNGGPGHKTNGFGRSWISVESLESQTTGRTDERGDHMDAGYQDIDDDSILADFKMPDLGTSFDFGGSFMDEVLKALNEKESQLEAGTDKLSTGSSDDRFASPSKERSRSLSPPPEVQATPPPLPSQPPRTEQTPSPKQDSRKLQAKVKPMSTSDEKMMDEAISMAEEFTSQRERAQMIGSDSPFERPADTDSSPSSPRLISRIKASIKRSPKQERKRNFSDSLNQERDDDVPPEAQEAYNMLVVHGSVKEGSRGFHSDIEKRESQISTGSSGHNFAFADSSSSSVSRTPDRDTPVRTAGRHSSERSSVSPPKLNRASSSSSGPDRPTPKPRAEPPPPTLPKRGEAPVPKPRPEIQRVEPVQRPPPPVPAKEFDTSAFRTESTASSNAFDNPLLIKEDEWKKSEESLRSDRNSQNLQEEKSDVLNTSTDSGKKSNSSPSDVSQSSTSKFSFFEEDFDQPSPREIMSKLARESRLRRSLDHQNSAPAVESGVNKNLREPQGIPTKSSFSTSGEEEDVDTNPLRMLRGGVIPVRGGRGGSGTSSNKPTLRHPKLHFSTGSAIQHSVSMDSGNFRTEGMSQSNVNTETENDPFESRQSSPPALPPREKNGEEIDLMQKLFGSDVTREDCLEALQDTKWDLHKAIKFIKLKQLLSIQLGDASRCKEALLACDWNVQNAADFLLNGEDHRSGRRTPPSPECVDV